MTRAPKPESSWAIERAVGDMPTRPTVAPPSSRPATLPSALRTGTRRSSDSAAPMVNSASARAPAVWLRTISIRRRSQAATIEVLGADADPADRAQHRREIQGLGVDRHRGRNDRRPDVVEGAAELARRVRQLGGMPNAMAQAEPFEDIGFERIDDEQVHGMQGGAGRGDGRPRARIHRPRRIVSRC